MSCSPLTKTKRRTQTQHCTTRRLKRRVMLTASPVSAKASLTRAGTVSATGHLLLGDGSTRLVLDLNHRNRLPAGAYTLTLTWHAGKTTHTSRQRITLA